MQMVMGRPKYGNLLDKDKDEVETERRSVESQLAEKYKARRDARWKGRIRPTQEMRDALLAECAGELAAEKLEKEKKRQKQKAKIDEKRSNDIADNAKRVVPADRSLPSHMKDAFHSVIAVGEVASEALIEKIKKGEVSDSILAKLVDTLRETIQGHRQTNVERLKVAAVTAAHNLGVPLIDRCPTNDSAAAAASDKLSQLLELAKRGVPEGGEIIDAEPSR
jgi:hypothetical protein